MNSIVRTGLILAAFLAGSSAQTSFQCGVPQPGVNRLIVRGSEANPLDWPWHVVVMHKATRNAAPKYACGGTLIHKNFVITARHCVQEEGTNDLLSENAIVVRLGVREVHQVTQGVQEIKIFGIHAFEDEADELELRNDIAILELRSSVKFSKHVLPACLIDRRITPDDRGTVIGFGLTEAGTTSSVLKMAKMPVVDPLRCVRSDRTGFGGTLHEGHFCAGFQNGTTVCNGDSGGGFFLKQNRTWYLAGIVAFSLANEGWENRCRHDSYGAFTKVFRYLEWIRGVTGLTGINPPTIVQPQKEPPEPKCGKRNPNGIGNSRRSNIREAQYGEFPWLILVMEKSEYLCEGSLIHPRVVLTMTRGDNNPADLIVRGGDWNQANNNEPHSHQDRYVSEIIVHPQSAHLLDAYDIALLLLTTPFDLQETIQPICLPPPGTRYDHHRCFASAWFRKNLGEPFIYHNKLQKEEISIMPFAQCQEKIREYLDIDSSNMSNVHSSNRPDGLICAGDDGSSLVGALGSPLVCPIQGSQDHYYQAGMLAEGYEFYFNSGVHGVYTFVPLFRSWIDQQIQAHQIDTQSYSYQ